MRAQKKMEGTAVARAPSIYRLSQSVAVTDLIRAPTFVRVRGSGSCYLQHFLLAAFFFLTTFFFAAGFFVARFFLAMNITSLLTDAW
jgi:hypothetical protein